MTEVESFYKDVQELLDYLSPPDESCNCHFCWHQNKVIDGKKKIEELLKGTSE